MNKTIFFVGIVCFVSSCNGSLFSANLMIGKIQKNKNEEWQAFENWARNHKGENKRYFFSSSEQSIKVQIFIKSDSTEEIYFFKESVSFELTQHRMGKDEEKVLDFLISLCDEL